MVEEGNPRLMVVRAGLGKMVNFIVVNASPFTCVGKWFMRDNISCLLMRLVKLLNMILKVAPRVITCTSG